MLVHWCSQYENSLKFTWRIVHTTTSVCLRFELTTVLGLLSFFSGGRDMQISFTPPIPGGRELDFNPFYLVSLWEILLTNFKYLRVFYCSLSYLYGQKKMKNFMITKIEQMWLWRIGLILREGWGHTNIKTQKHFDSYYLLSNIWTGWLSRKTTHSRPTYFNRM